jgi:hypothetical protein
LSEGKPVGKSKCFTKRRMEDLLGGMATWYSDLDESKGDGHWEIRATGSVRLSSHGLRSGDGRSFFSLLFLFFFFEFSVVKATLKSPPPGF